MKTLKIIAIELVILVLTAMSFVGLYQKDEYRVKNLIPEYKLGMDFTEQRVITMKVDDSIKETLVYDKDGNLVEEKEEGVEYTEENGYKEEIIKVNEDSILTEENYEKTKTIILNRLHNLDVGEYSVNQNKETGEIVIKIQENDNSDMISYYLGQSGKFSLTDAETDEILLDETYIKEVGLLYGSNLNEEGKTESYVYLQLKFNKEGTTKLEELSKIYVETTTTTQNEEGEEEETTTEKEVTINLNDTEMGNTVITNILYNNTIAIPLGTSTDTKEFTQQTENATNIVKILKSGTLPIIYNIEETQDTNIIGKTKEKAYMVALLTITIILSIYLIIKYKTRGLLANNLLIGYLALVLIVLRFTNVIISQTGMIGIALSIVLNYIFILKVINCQKNFNENLIKHFLDLAPIYIISIIMAFSNSTHLSSFGMTATWGIMLIYIYNLIFTKTVIEELKEGKDEKK